MHTTLTIRPADWQRYPRLAQSAALSPVDHNRAVARASVRAALPVRYTVVDCHQIGAAYYAPEQRSLTPHMPEWQAAVLDAIRRMRRWSYYSDTLPHSAAPNEPLDGCGCRVCLLRASASPS